MAGITGVPLTSIPAEGDTTFPALDSLTTFDLVGPVAANRQPVQLRTRGNTLRTRVNELITAVNDIGDPIKFLPRDGSDAMTGALAMGSQKITGLAAAAAADDAPRMDQVMLLTGANAMSGALNMGSQKITAVAAAAAATDGIPRSHVDNRLVLKHKLTDGPSVNNSQSLVDDSALFFSVLANEVWLIHLYLDIVTTSLAKWRYAFSVPSGATGEKTATAYTVNGDVFEDITDSAIASTKIIGFDDDDVGRLFHCRAYLVVGGTPGSVKLRWAQGSAEATDTKVRAGSWLWAIRCGG